MLTSDIKRNTAIKLYEPRRNASTIASAADGMMLLAVQRFRLGRML